MNLGVWLFGLHEVMRAILKFPSGNVKTEAGVPKLEFQN